MKPSLRKIRNEVKLIRFIKKIKKQAKSLEARISKIEALFAEKENDELFKQD
jgi:hypothetical protein